MISVETNAAAVGLIEQAKLPSDGQLKYLRALYDLGATRRRVPPSELARSLDVRFSSVTGMLKRLAENGWIDYGSGAGARFTRDGFLVSRRAIRRRRVLESFLERVFDFEEVEVRAEAEALEHFVSTRVEQAIIVYLTRG